MFGTDRIAIVGFGPRGLAALEALIDQWPARRAVSVDIFDPCDWPAAGPSFNPDEPATCLLNLPLRSINLPIFKFGDVPSFQDWVTGAGPEAYLPRARLGAYLNARFQAVIAGLPPHIAVTHYKERVCGLDPQKGVWTLATEGGRAFGPYRNVLLSLGQPATRPDPQLALWHTHANHSGAQVLPAYPGRDLVDRARLWAGKTVALRGMGLSAIDVIRMLTVELGGAFDGDRYVPSGREPALIAPFSLDGHLPAPKPLNAAIDAVFDTTKDEDQAFRAAMRSSDPMTDVAAQLTDTALRVLEQAGAAVSQSDVKTWLEAELDTPGCQEKRGTLDALTAHLAEAEGRVPPSIGYAIGQIWRKWQPLLRGAFDRMRIAPEEAKRLVTFDEGLKRYSYGAPVFTLRQVLALIDNGLVTTSVAVDPKITPTQRGWGISSGDQTIAADAIVDCVLPSPELDQISEPLIDLLRHQGIVVPVKDLGIRCDPDGAVRGERDQLVAGLHVVGRLTNGSTIANDSVHDCFGLPVQNWAKAVADIEQPATMGGPLGGTS